jgi:plasmid stabilization system protein ParE
MTIKIAKSAHQDLLDGYTFYEKQKEDLGNYFIKTLFADIDTLQDTAGIHTSFFNYHRKLSHTFPFAIYYKIINNIVHIYAVLDCRRKPSWIREKIEKLS